MSQILRPISTVSAGAWTTTGSTIHGELDEGIAQPDDGATHCSVAADNSDLEVRIASATDPLTGSFHTLYWRAKSSNATGVWLLPGALIRVYLVEGATIRAQAEAYHYQYSTGSYTLTEAEANAITDYTDLRIRVRLLNGAGQSADLSTLELQVPSLDILALPRGEMFQPGTPAASTVSPAARGMIASVALPIGGVSSPSATGHPAAPTAVAGLGL